MRIEIARLHKRLNATMIYVTHDQVEAMTLADKIVVLQSGRIEQVGTPLQLFDDPENQFVAGFIGSPRMNFLRARVTAATSHGVTVALTDHADTLVETALAGATVSVGDSVTLGVRPEHFSFAEDAGSALDITCDVTEQMGEISYIYADAGAETQIIVERRHDRSIRDGDRITVYIPKEKCFLFDQNGHRIR